MTSADARARLRDALTALGWRPDPRQPDSQVLCLNRFVLDLQSMSIRNETFREVFFMEHTVRKALTAIWNELDQPAAGSAERAEETAG